MIKEGTIVFLDEPYEGHIVGVVETCGSECAIVNFFVDGKADETVWTAFKLTEIHEAKNAFEIAKLRKLGYV